MKTLFKLYLDYTKEEKWLNKMSAKGLHMRSFLLGFYKFEENLSTQYTYRLELLEQLPSHPASKSYIQFLEDTGVEIVDTYFRWVYLRMPLSEGTFDLHTDYASLIAHHKKIVTLQSAILLLQISPLATNLVHIGQGYSPTAVFIPFFALTTIALSTMVVRGLKTINRLKKEQQIRES